MVKLSMLRSSCEKLHALARSLAADLGLGPLDGVSVGGGPDGNFTAGPAARPWAAARVLVRLPLLFMMYYRLVPLLCNRG